MDNRQGDHAAGDAEAANRRAWTGENEKGKFKSPNPDMTGTQVAALEVPKPLEASGGTRLDIVPPEDRKKYDL